MKIKLENFKLSIGSISLTKRHLIPILTIISGLFFHSGDIYEFVKLEILKKPIIKRDYISEFIESDPLDDLTQELADNYGCSYTNVNLFHNGITSSSGFKCKRMSCFSEGLGPGRVSLMQKLQNQVIEPFKPKVRKLKLDQELYISDVTQDADPYFKNRMPQYGMTSIFYVAIYDKRYIDKHGKWHLKGFLAYAWDKPTNLSVEKRAAMKAEVERVVPIVIQN